MTAWLRRAGRGRTRDDVVVVWSVAEGERGRRWRWMQQVYQGFLGVAGLVECAADGRLARLELTGFGGLLTFHPEADGRSAHGNIVTTRAVLPIATHWQPDWGVGIAADPFGSAVAGWSGVGMVVSWDHDELTWREPGAHRDVAVLPLDERGVPQLIEAVEWPLEE